MLNRALALRRAGILAVLGIVAVLLVLGGKAAGEADKEEKIEKAIVVLHPVGDSKVHGSLTFAQKDGAIEISGEVTGLSPGQHAFHVHEFGDCSSLDAGSAGGHFNPTNMPHGGPTDAKRHVGDLGNIEADKNGKAVVKMTDKVIQLQGPSSIVGRSVIIHAGVDDLKTQPTGNAGARAACGVIGIANPKPPAPKK
jgi:Cu-Zn family superoxide dismutase